LIAFAIGILQKWRNRRPRLFRYFLINLLVCSTALFAYIASVHNDKPTSQSVPVILPANTLKFAPVPDAPTVFSANTSPFIIFLSVSNERSGVWLDLTNYWQPKGVSQATFDDLPRLDIAIDNQHLAIISTTYTQNLPELDNQRRVISYPGNALYEVS